MISIFIFLAWDTNTKAIQKKDQAERRADEESKRNLKIETKKNTTVALKRDTVRVEHKEYADFFIQSRSESVKLLLLSTPTIVARHTH